MNEAQSVFTQWYFQLPNMMLAAAMYTLLGRYLLSLFFPANSDKVIWVVFRNITDPIIRLVRLITPEIIADGLLPVFAFVWLLGLRIGLYMLLFRIFGQSVHGIGG